MSEARILNAAARLVQGGLMRSLYTLCETQHQISTAKLEQYLDDLSDKLKTCAFDIRMGYDALAKVLDGYKQGAKAETDAGDEARAECRKLRTELAKARELLEHVDMYGQGISLTAEHSIREWLGRNK